MKKIKAFFMLLILHLSILLSSCASYETEAYTFRPPPGFDTKQYTEGTDNNSGDNFERLIFSKGVDIAFWVDRKNIPSGSDLDDVFDAYRMENEKSKFDLNYQFIAQNEIEQNGQAAIEYIYRQFSGEWYWQRREIWMEHDGMIYSLVCSEPVESTPGKEIPVSDTCLQLVERFTFNNE